MTPGEIRLVNARRKLMGNPHLLAPVESHQSLAGFVHLSFKCPRCAAVGIGQMTAHGYGGGHFEQTRPMGPNIRYLRELCACGIHYVVATSERSGEPKAWIVYPSDWTNKVLNKSRDWPSPSPD